LPLQGFGKWFNGIFKTENTMKKHYCSYELSSLAKKAGFDEKCKAIYYNEKITERANSYQNSTILDKIYLDKNSITAPELTHLQQWVYEKFSVWITAKCIAREKANMFTQSNSLNPRDFDCPYKALENGLMEFLKTKS
jgi:hypothetical protein